MVDFNNPRMVSSNGLNMAVFEEGAGLPVIMCHGFPEIAYSWRHQIPAVAAAGFHAIAPDQRGYGRTTGSPKGKDAVDQYDMEHLTGDLVGMMDEMGLEKAIFCGHDWGGFVVWQMALMHPERVAGVIGVNTPYSPRSPMDPIELMKQAFGEDMYIVYFQKHGQAEGLFEKDIARSMRFWYRKSSMTLEEYDAQPQEAKNLAFAAAYNQPEEEWGGESLLTPEEHAYYVDAFTRSGYEGGINWYRNFTRNWEKSEGQKETIDVPCLMISAANDFVLRPAMTDGMENYIPDLEKHIIPDCGHWTQSEKPEELSAIMTDWLKRRFG